MLIDSSILQDPKWRLVPPAWSLGVELQAYLLLPFIIYFKYVKIILAIISLCIFIIASIGIINTNHFGYRLLPGVFFMFILGASIYKNTADNGNSDLFDLYFPIIVYIILLFLLIILGINKMLITPFVRETILGVIIGLPIIVYLGNHKIKIPFNSFLGDLSYGLFLSHFLAIWIIDYSSLINKIHTPYLHLAMVFILSIIISLTGMYAIEKKIKNYRFNLFGSSEK